MKTILALALLFCLLAPMAHADPWLVCDVPTDGTPTEFTVEVVKDGITEIVTGAYTVKDGQALLLNLSGRPNGVYTFRAMWSGPVVWSDWGASVDIKKIGGPGNERVVRQ